MLGYHGCDAAISKKLIAGEPFEPSDNAYDWLGPGAYFWEANPRRGLDYAHELMRLGRGPRIVEPDVVGAVIELRLCLDLTTLAGIEQVKTAHADLMTIFEKAGQPPPQNLPDGRRNLDCAVLRCLHEMRARKRQPPIDTVKALFIEGQPIYEGSGFNDKTHEQICVCNPDCIKGVFRVRESHMS